MKIKSLVATAALTTVALSSLLWSAAPANAAGYWSTYTFSSNWYCDETRDTQSVYYQACYIRSGDYIQAALIVTNRAGSWPRTIEASVELVDGLAFAHCAESSIGDRQTRACFTPTVYKPCTWSGFATAKLMINGGALKGSSSKLDYRKCRIEA